VARMKVSELLESIKQILNLDRLMIDQGGNRICYLKKEKKLKFDKKSRNRWVFFNNKNVFAARKSANRAAI
jgi:hypothetical protein